MKLLVLLFCAACHLASTQGDDIRDFQNGKANEMVWKPNSKGIIFDDVNGIETLSMPFEGGIPGSIDLKRMADMEDRVDRYCKQKNRGCNSYCTSKRCCQRAARTRCLCEKYPPGNHNRPLMC